MINSVYSHYAVSNTTSAKEPVLSWRSRTPVLTQPPLTPQLSSAAASGLLTSSSHRAPNTDPNPPAKAHWGYQQGCRGRASTPLRQRMQLGKQLSILLHIF